MIRDTQGPKPGSKRKPCLTDQIRWNWLILNDEGTFDIVSPPKPPKKYAQRKRRVLAQCLCYGPNSLRVVNWQDIDNGKSKCCGCIKPLRTSYHDLIYSPTYNSWSNMLQRCLNPNNPNFERYGAAGIGVIKRWLEFGNFLEDMCVAPDGLTIDRMDGTQGYFKENCRWATRQEQAANRQPWRAAEYVGVHKSQDCSKFISLFRADYIGLFGTAEEAACARDRAAREYYGDDFIYYRNFPDEEAGIR
jgi:hypothetical protein